MKTLFNLFVFLAPSLLVAQKTEVSIFGGPYWNNIETTNQKSGAFFGSDFSYHFNKSSELIMRLGYGENRYFEDDYVARTGVPVPENGTNTTNKDLQVSVLCSRNFQLSERFELTTAAGFGILSTQNTAFFWIHNIQDGTTISIGDDASVLYGFPLRFGAGYQLNSRWSANIEGNGMLQGSEGLIGLFFGPKVSMRLGPKEE